MGRYADIRARFANWTTADPGASNVLTLPGGPTQADEIIGILAVASDNVTLSATGFTAEVGTNAGTLCRGSFLWKRATGGETTVTVTHTSGNSIALLPFVLRGCVRTGNPVEAKSSVGAQNTGAVTSTAITTVTPKALVIAAALEAGDSDTSGAVTFGTHNLGDPVVTKILDRTIESLTDELSMSVARGWKLLPGDTGAYTFTFSGLVAGGDNVGMLLAFTPELITQQLARSRHQRRADRDTARPTFDFRSRWDFLRYFTSNVSVAAGGNITVTPGTATLTIASFAPKLNLTVIPGKLALTTTTFAPQLKLAVVPPTKALTITTFAPTVLAPRLVTPGVATLTITRFAPQANLAVIPGKLALTLTTFAPQAKLGIGATPGTLALSTTTFAPAVTVTANVRAVPGKLSLTTTAFAPTVTASSGTVIVPDTDNLVITTFRPIVSSSNGSGSAPAAKRVRYGSSRGYTVS